MQGRYGSLKEEIGRGLEHARATEMSQELKATELHRMKILSAYLGLRMNDLPQAYEASSQALEAALDEGGPIDHVGLALQLRGLILAKMKRFDEALAAAENLKQRIAKSEIQNEVRQYHRLMGEIAREKDDLAKAVVSFETAASFLPHENYKTDLHILYLDSLASAYHQKGDLDKARNTYESILSLTTGRVRWGDLYARSFYRLAKILQEQGQKEKAAGFYRRFLEVWSQADPGLPEIADARKQVTALGARPSS
jgi:tetratricopeptide (TPR) repeat protein